MRWLLLAAIRLVCCLASLLLVQCISGPGRRPPATPPLAGPVLAPKRTAPAAAAAPTETVETLLRALLDTTSVGGLRAANARLRLRAGSEVRAFYSTTYAPAWLPPTAPDSLGLSTNRPGSDSLNANALSAIELLAHATEYGLRPADYGAVRLRALRDSLKHPALPAVPSQVARQQARFEVYLSDAVLRFMRDLARGRLLPNTAPAREKAAGPAAQPAVALRAALIASKVAQAMLAGQPANREYQQLQRALARWLSRPSLVDSTTHEAQYQQAALNLERWRWGTIDEPEYVLINIPAYELLVLAHDSVKRRHRVIVGKPDWPTPVLNSAIRYFTLAPTWQVPYSIATKDILPLIKEDAGCLARNSYVLYDNRGRERNARDIDWSQVTPENFNYTIQQAAGDDNALGNIIFRFNNPYSVYLHDTPRRRLFALPNRAISHGCVRVAQPMLLAAYLLHRAGQTERLATEAESAKLTSPRDVRLARPMPLHIRYATCTAENGRLRFWPDVYQRDEPVRRALFGPDPGGKLK